MIHGTYVIFSIPDAAKMCGGFGEVIQPKLASLVAVREAAYKTTDGLTAGIYQKAGKDPLTGRATPEAVVILQPDGLNLRCLFGGEAVLAQFPPSELADLQSRRT